ncbi:hypothetical protein LCGC14_1898290, partial [marine sediment metagenome]
GGLANIAGKALRAGALAGGVAVAGLGVAALKMGLDFEKSMAEVKTLLPDISEEGFGQLKTSVLDLSKELGIATSEAVPALYQAISAGVPPDNVMDFMRTASKAAIGGVTDLETAVDGITSVVNAYGEGAIDAGVASDQMFTAVKLGKTTFEELSASLFNVIPTAAASGVEFGDIAASLAVMTAQGTKTSVATTGLRQALVEVGKTGTNLDKALRELAGKGFNELIEQGVSMPTIFQRLRASMPDQEFKDLFGSVEAMTSVLQITGPNFEATGDAMKAMAESGGAVEGAFETMADTASFKLNKAINLLKVTLTEVGVKILPVLTKALDKALPFLEKNLPIAIKKVEKFLKDIRPHVEAFAKTFVAGLTVLRDAWQFLAEQIGSKKLMIIAALVAIGVAVWLAFGPVGVAAIAIIGMIALIGLIRQNWDAIKKQFEDVEAFVTNIPIIGALVEAMVAVVKDKIDAAIEIFLGLKALIEEVVTFVKAIVEGDWSQAWESAKEIVKIALNLLIDFIRVTFLGTIFVLMKELGPKILAGIGDLAGLLVQKGKDLLEGFVKGYIGIWQEVFSFFVDLPGRLVSAIGNLLPKLWSAGWDLLDGLWKGIKARATKLFEDLADLADDILGAITNPLGIGSPSKAMRLIGQQAMEGLRLGLEDQSVKLNATVGNIAGGIVATGGAAGGGTSRALGAREVHLHINSRFPPDRRALRSEVRALQFELDRNRLLGLT